MFNSPIHKTQQQLVQAAREATTDYITNGTDLTEAVVKAASAITPVTSEHVRRICEMTYHDAYERMFAEKTGMYQYVSFDPPDAILASEMLDALQLGLNNQANFDKLAEKPVHSGMGNLLPADGNFNEAEREKALAATLLFGGAAVDQFRGFNIERSPLRDAAPLAAQLAGAGLLFSAMKSKKEREKQSGLSKEASLSDAVYDALPSHLDTRAGFIDPRSEDFAKNQAVGRAMGVGGVIGIPVASVAAGTRHVKGEGLLKSIAKGQLTGLAAASLPTALTYKATLDAFKEDQAKGINPATGLPFNLPRIQRLSSNAKKRAKSLSPKARKRLMARDFREEGDSLHHDIGHGITFVSPKGPSADAYREAVLSKEASAKAPSFFKRYKSTLFGSDIKNKKKAVSSMQDAFDASKKKVSEVKDLINKNKQDAKALSADFDTAKAHMDDIYDERVDLLDHLSLDRKKFLNRRPNNNDLAKATNISNPVMFNSINKKLDDLYGDTFNRAKDRLDTVKQQQSSLKQTRTTYTKDLKSAQDTLTQSKKDLQQANYDLHRSRAATTRARVGTGAAVISPFAAYGAVKSEQKESNKLASDTSYESRGKQEMGQTKQANSISMPRKFQRMNTHEFWVKAASGAEIQDHNPTRDIQKVHRELKDSISTVKSELYSAEHTEKLAMIDMVKQARAGLSAGHSMEQVLLAAVSVVDATEPLMAKTAHDLCATIIEACADHQNSGIHKEALIGGAIAKIKGVGQRGLKSLFETRTTSEILNAAGDDKKAAPVPGMPKMASALPEVNPNHPIPQKFKKLAEANIQRKHLEVTLDELNKNLDYFNEKLVDELTR